jgi:hypothetical protein
VEFTANPIAAYPASVTDRRAVDDGEIIEAVAVTLVPYRDDHAELEPMQQRAHVARRIFIERGPGGVPAEALPLAMLQLDRGEIKWVDPFLVRREVGAEHAGVAGFGLAPRGLREAFVLQQEAHLLEVMNQRSGRPGGLRFPAAEVFRALPPAGQLPLEAIERLGELRYSQSYFPPQMPCAMSLVPDDELSVLVDEALLLPPIDLTVPAEDLDFTSLLILVPVPRATLDSDRRRIALELIPAAPGVVVRRQPLDVFRRLAPALPSGTGALLGPRPGSPEASAGPDAARLDGRWRTSLERARDMGGRLWFVRRRTLQWRVLGRVPNSDPPRFADPARENTEPAAPRADEAHALTVSTPPGSDG